MKNPLPLFVLLCLITMGCREPELVDRSSPVGKETAVESAADRESTGDTEDSAFRSTNSLEELYDKTEREFFEAFGLIPEGFSEAENSKARQAIFKEYTARFFKIYKTHPESETGQRALEWIAERNANSDLGKQALAILISDHKDREALPIFVANSIYGTPSKATETMLRGLVNGKAPPKLKGVALFTLAGYLASLAEQQSSLEANKESFDPETTEYIENSKAPLSDVRALYERVKKDYADLKIAKSARKTLGEMADDSIYVMDNLSVGCTAPEIEGEDLDAVKFKLSDYRGKVVVLDFWGDW